MAEQQTQQQTAPDQEPQTGRTNGYATGRANGSGGDGQAGEDRPASTSSASGPTEAGNSRQRPAAATSRKLLIGLVVGAVVLVAALWGVRHLIWSRHHVGTDDAFITGNLVNISPVNSGTLSELEVSEGDIVHKGQLLARLSDDGPTATLRQAEAAYRAALTQVPQARSSYLYQKQATDAAIAKAQSALATQEARTRAADQQIILASRTTQSQVGQAASQIRAMQAQADQAAAQVKTAQATVVANRQAIQTAERGTRSLEARLQSAQADVDKTSKDEARYRGLLAKEAVNQQQYDAVNAQYASAQSTLRSLQEQIAQARSQADQARAAVAQSEAQLAAAREGARAAQQQVGVAQAGMTLARANQTQVPVQAANRAATATQSTEAQADIAAAEAGRTQDQIRQQQIATALANLKQAEAALQNARVTVQDTYIYAPTDGTVVRKSTNVGASLSSGQTILTITQGNGVYVTANFKETQIGEVRVGQPVEIEVDALSGKVFRGIVGAINAATGATTSLLPPDNATGNFTKVVQRIPVKIAIVPGDSGKREATVEDIALLRQGMSLTATIDISDTTPHPERVPAGYDKGVVPGGGR